MSERYTEGSPQGEGSALSTAREPQGDGAKGGEAAWTLHEARTMAHIHYNGNFVYSVSLKIMEYSVAMAMVAQMNRSGITLPTPPQAGGEG